MRVRIEHLSKVYSEGEGQQLEVIKDANCLFESASLNAIIGKSGIGKSTLLHLLGGLDRPTSGAVFFDDQDIFALGDEQLASLRGEKVGFVFQFHHLLPEFSALENVAMPLIISGFSEEESLERASDILGEMGLASRESHRPGQLSGGEQQRVAISRALVVRPKLLLADEPTGNLDQVTAGQVQELLLSSGSKLETTIIIVTHNAELAKSMQNVYEMQAGGQLQKL